MQGCLHSGISLDLRIVEVELLEQHTGVQAMSVCFLLQLHQQVIQSLGAKIAVEVLPQLLVHCKIIGS